MVLCGFYSLCERKVLAVVQLRVGPGLFLFGILTPITDGVKLFIKFIVFTLQFDYCLMYISIYILLCCMYVLWFFFPIGYIVSINFIYSYLLILIIHSVDLMVSCVFIGCLIYNTCYVYIASIRSILFSLLIEYANTLILLILYIVNINGTLNLKDMSLIQLYSSIFFFVGFFFCRFFFLFEYNNCFFSGR